VGAHQADRHGELTGGARKEEPGGPAGGGTNARALFEGEAGDGAVSEEQGAGVQLEEDGLRAVARALRKGGGRGGARGLRASGNLCRCFGLGGHSAGAPNEVLGDDAYETRFSFDE
jgi:hypothetical protein